MYKISIHQTISDCIWPNNTYSHTRQRIFSLNFEVFKYEEYILLLTLLDKQLERSYGLLVFFMKYCKWIWDDCILHYFQYILVWCSFFYCNILFINIRKVLSTFEWLLVKRLLFFLCIIFIWANPMWCFSNAGLASAVVVLFFEFVGFKIYFRKK